MLTQNVTRNVAQRRKNPEEISSIQAAVMVFWYFTGNSLSFALSKFGQHMAESDNSLKLWLVYE
jgi:hypothetical protein